MGRVLRGEFGKRYSSQRRVTRGGARAGAGRGRVLSDAEVKRIGAACEEAWSKLRGLTLQGRGETKQRGPNRRPYESRDAIILTASLIYTSELSRFVSPRQVESAWKQARRFGWHETMPAHFFAADTRCILEYFTSRFEAEWLQYHRLWEARRRLISAHNVSTDYRRQT